MARKGINHGGKVKLGGSSVRKQKANLSNTYGIKPSSGGPVQGPTGAVTGNRTSGNKNSRKASLKKVRGS